MPYLYEQLISELVKQIERGDLKPGDKLPTELELTSMYDVSRITAKRAMKELAAGGYVTRYRGRGSFVAELHRGEPKDQAETSGAGPRRRIGFVCPSVSDMFGLKMLNGIEHRCREEGIDLSVLFSSGSIDIEARAIEDWRADGIDGIIVFPAHGETYNKQLLRAVLDNFPIVQVDRGLVGIGAPVILTNHYAACAELVQWLIDQGHSSLALISPTATGTSSLEARHRAFLDTIERARSTRMIFAHRFFVDSVIPGEWTDHSIDMAREQLGAFLQHHTDISAVVTSEFSLALLTKRAIEQVDELCARNIQLSGFDVHELFADMRSVPYIQQDEFTIGMRATELLVDRIAGKPVDRITYIPHKLVTPA